MHIRVIQDTMLAQGPPGEGVQGIGIRRIIASTDPNYPLEDGDLLILVDVPTQYFTDFSEYSTGVAPSDWSQPWAVATLSIVADGAATGGKVLRCTKGSSSRSLLAWDGVAAVSSQYADVEIVYKWRASATNASVRTILRGSGSAGSENGQAPGYHSNGQLILSYTYTNGTVNFPSSNDAPDIVPDTWYITRAQAIGSTLRVRVWAAADPEPGTWNIDTATTFADPGYVGLFPFEAATTEYDYVGFGFNGDPAPTEAP